MSSSRVPALLSLLLLLFILSPTQCFDYGDALSKSILFYEAQRSGKLPPNQRAAWRSDSGLEDGKASGVDLVGGYFDAGDNVKFGLPMAFTITMLSWSVVEYGPQLQASGELGHTLEAIKWGTDYFIKAHPEPNVLWGEVGDGMTDHNCWQRPEEMQTSRQAYRLDASKPGSDLAGETAAAMAAASIAFRASRPAYSKRLLRHARQLFTFADTFRGKYDQSIPVAQKYYASRSGYSDELLWSAIWLFKATGQQKYLDYVARNAVSLGGTGWAMTEFSWDVKYAGVQVLAAKVLLEGKAGAYGQILQQYKSKADYFTCACLQESPGSQVQRTPGGLMFVRQWNNMQYVTAGSFLLTAYSDYLTAAGQSVKCRGRSVNPSEILNFANSQVDYILGNNPRATSYVVGFGSNYPQHVHHRAASIVSFKLDKTLVSCRGGYATWYTRQQSDPNLLVGALVGGPDEGDNFADERQNFEQTEPATYNNGPLVGLLARFHVGGGSNSRILLSSQKGIGPVIAINQSMTHSWTSRQKKFFRYEVQVKNTSQRTVKNLQLKIKGLTGQHWGLSKTPSNKFTLAHSLGPQQASTFVYVQAGPPATLLVAKFQLLA